jgi:hypothetical protein
MMDIRCPPHTLQTFSGVVTCSIYLQGRSLGPTSIEKKATSLGTVQSWVWGWVPIKWCHRRGACGGAADTLPSNSETRERERERAPVQEGETEPGEVLPQSILAFKYPFCFPH